MPKKKNEPEAGEHQKIYMHNKCLINLISNKNQKRSGLGLYFGGKMQVLGCSVPFLPAFHSHRLSSVVPTILSMASLVKNACEVIKINMLAHTCRCK